ncbi:hypothetical protein GQ44DRAFT_490093 [Phaeosphaeriaceae sp. PMI808]|nr:hypothetical protein GQ44DRAFT_490093 [Phaeosphaeriaceae sp. PMI808]
MAFKYSELYELVSGDSKATTREATKQWDVFNKDLTIIVITCETAAAAWARLVEQFDGDTSKLTIYLSSPTPPKPPTSQPHRYSPVRAG